MHTLPERRTRKTSLWRRALSLTLAAALVAPPPGVWANPKEKSSLADEAAAFKSKVISKTSASSYSEHDAKDLDRELAELEKKAAANDKVLAELKTLRIKLAPAYYRDKVLEDPELYKEMRFQDYLDLRDAAQRGQFPMFFSEQKALYRTGKDRPDFATTDGGRALTAREVVALWKKLKELAAGSGEAVQRDMRAMQRSVQGIETRLKSASVQERKDAAEDLSRVFDNMSQANLADLARADQEMFRDLLVSMNHARETAPADVQQFLYRDGSVGRFDERLFQLKDDPDMAQMHALMRDVKPPPEWRTEKGDETKPDADRLRWWDAFTAQGNARLMRGGMLRVQVETVTGILERDDLGAWIPPEERDHELRRLLEEARALNFPGAMEDWLIRARAALDQRPAAKETVEKISSAAKLKHEYEAKKLNGRPLEDLDEEELARVKADPEAQAMLQADTELFEFSQKHKAFIEKYTAAQGMGADYMSWLRQNMAILPDGTLVDSRTLKIDPATLPHFDPEQKWLKKTTRMIGGREIMGLEYSVNWEKDGVKEKMTRIWTSELGPGGVPVSVSLVIDQTGKLREREMFLPSEAGAPSSVRETGEFSETHSLVKGRREAVSREGDKETVTRREDGDFDPTGKLAKGTSSVPGQEAFETVASEEDEDLGNGRIRRVRKKVEKSGKAPRERTIEILSKEDRRLLARRVEEMESFEEDGKEKSRPKRRSDVYYDERGDLVALETQILDKSTVLFGEEWYIGKPNAAQIIYDPDTGRPFSATNPDDAKRIAEIVSSAKPRWVHRVTNGEAKVQKLLIAGEVELVNGRPSLIGPGLYRVYTEAEVEVVVEEVRGKNSGRLISRKTAKEKGSVLSFSFELEPLLPLPREARLEALREFAQQAYAAMSAYQPKVISIGFWGASDIASNPDALVGFLDETLKQAAQGGWKPVVLLDANDTAAAPYLVTFYTEKKDEKDGRPTSELTPVMRLYASYRGGVAGHGSNPWGWASKWNKGKTVPSGLTVWIQNLSGGKGSLPLMHIVGPDEKFIPEYKISQDNKITGHDWGPTANSLFGARQFEQLNFVRYTYDGSGKPTRHETIYGDWNKTYEGPTMFGTVWEAVDKAGETLVAFAGAVGAGALYLATEAIDQTARLYETGIEAAFEIADPAAARAYRKEVDKSRAFRDSLKSEFLKEAEANIVMNPLVREWRQLGMSDADIERMERTHRDHYIFEAPNIMAREASDPNKAGWEKALWVTASFTTNLGLQTGKGFVYMPLGGLGAARPWVVNGVPKMGAVWTTVGGRATVGVGQLMAPQNLAAQGYQALFKYGMGYLGVQGAAESAIGKGGILDAGINWFKKGGPQAEFEFYQSLNNFTAATVPYLTGLMGQRKGKGKSGPPADDGAPAKATPLAIKVAQADAIVRTFVKDAKAPASPADIAALITDLHPPVRPGETGKDGKNPPKVGNYTWKQIAMKARGVKDFGEARGWSKDQIRDVTRALMEMEVLGDNNPAVAKTVPVEPAKTGSEPPAKPGEPRGPPPIDKTAKPTADTPRVAAAQKALKDGGHKADLTDAQKEAVSEAMKEARLKPGEREAGDIRARVEGKLKAAGLDDAQIKALVESDVFADTRMVDMRSVRPSQSGKGDQQVQQTVKQFRDKMTEDGVDASDPRAVAKWLRDKKYGDGGDSIPAFITPDGQVMVVDSHHRGSALLIFVNELIAKGVPANELPQLKVKVLGDYSGIPNPAEFYRDLMVKHKKGEFAEFEAEYYKKIGEIAKREKPGERDQAARDKAIIELWDKLAKDFDTLPNDPMRSAVGNALYHSGIEGKGWKDYNEFDVKKEWARRKPPLDIKEFVRRAKERNPGRTIDESVPEGDPAVLFEVRQELLSGDTLHNLFKPRQFRNAKKWTPELQKQFVRVAARLRDAELAMIQAGIPPETLHKMWLKKGQRTLAEVTKAYATATGKGTLDPSVESKFKEWLEAAKDSDALKDSMPKQ